MGTFEADKMTDRFPTDTEILTEWPVADLPPDMMDFVFDTLEVEFCFPIRDNEVVQ